jgi:hypothetical protein
VASGRDRFGAGAGDGLRAAGVPDVVKDHRIARPVKQRECLEGGSHGRQLAAQPAASQSQPARPAIGLLNPGAGTGWGGGRVTVTLGPGDSGRPKLQEVRSKRSGKQRSIATSIRSKSLKKRKNAAAGGVGFPIPPQPNPDPAAIVG